MLGNRPRGTVRGQAGHSELGVPRLAGRGNRRRDRNTTPRGKAVMIEGSKSPPNAVKVVPGRGVGYQRGIVSRAEGTAAGDTAATTEGVQRVVKVFEYTS